MTQAATEYSRLEEVANIRCPRASVLVVGVPEARAGHVGANRRVSARADGSDPDSRLPGLDGLRGWAALAVLAGHCWFNSGMWKIDEGGLLALMAASSSGVDVFFVLSGFVLYLPWAEGRSDPSDGYWRKRAARLLPLYWMLLILAVGLEWLLPRLAEPTDVTGAGVLPLVAHLTFLHLPLEGLGVPTGLLPAALTWTLCIEVAFYAVLPVIARPFRKHPVAGVLTGVLLALTWRAAILLLAGRGRLGAVDDLAVRMAAQAPMFGAHFAVGMGAAHFAARARMNATTLRARRHLAKVGGLAAITGLIGLLATIELAGQRAVSGAGGEAGRYLDSLPVAAMAGVLVTGLAVGGGRLVRWATNTVAVHIGRWSYGLYLVHYPVILVLNGLGAFSSDGKATSFAGLLAATLFFSIVLAADAHYLVERPAIAWARERRSPAVTAPIAVAGS